MIPKIIHYVWLGGKPLPVEFQQYIEHWKELMPDWQFYCWNEDNFDITAFQYCREAYEAKKFAFASD